MLSISDRPLGLLLSSWLSINQLLGQPETEGEPQINVLELGSLAGTTLAGTVVLAKESIKEIKLAGTVADDIGKALASGKAQWVQVKGSEALETGRNTLSDTEANIEANIESSREPTEQDEARG